MNTTIYKYLLPYDTAFTIDLPRGATALSVGLQRGVITLWAEVDPTAEKVPVQFWIIGTGHSLQPVNARGDVVTFLGTVIVHHDDLPEDYVWHVYGDINKVA